MFAVPGSDTSAQKCLQAIPHQVLTFTPNKASSREIPDCRGAWGGSEAVLHAGLERTQEGIGLPWVPAGCGLPIVAVSVESMLVLLLPLFV